MTVVMNSYRSSTCSLNPVVSLYILVRLRTEETTCGTSSSGGSHAVGDLARIIPVNIFQTELFELPACMRTAAVART